MSPSSMNAHELIEDHHLVEDWFGCWPSFHDAEVQRIVLDRTHQDASGSFVAMLDVEIHGWLLVQQPSGELVQSRDALVSLRFESVSNLMLEGFNQQNVVTALNLQSDEAGLVVEFEHCYLFSSSFRAQKAQVLQVTAFRSTPVRR